MGFLKRLFGASSEAAPANPEAATVFSGYENLDVVGESYYQGTLQKLVGFPNERVRVEIEATLMAETDNQYDANAISVWISDDKVGHLSREDAARLRPGLLALQQRTGAAVALRGNIVGGGPGRPSFGVFLRYDPTDFGLRESEAAPGAVTPGFQVRIRTGLTEAIAEDQSNDSYDLSSQARVPTDRVQATTFLRQELATKTEPVERHFLYAYLEDLLYGARDEFASALAEFDATCEAHHADMASIRPALIAMYGGLPLIETYKQAAIRHQKAHDWAAALRWAEAGVSMYGTDALRAEFVDDLVQRVAKCRQKLEPASPRQERTSAPRQPAEVLIETLVCVTCGQPFDRVRVRGRKPHQCPRCRGAEVEGEPQVQ